MLNSLLRHDGWGIGLVRAPIAALLDPPAVPAVEWLPLAKPHGFYADPFAIEDGGTTYCFFEELSYRSNRGRIAFVALDDLPAGTPLRVEEAIATPYHLSYPYLVRHEDEIVCVPESFETGRVTAWAARDFPRGWYERATLLADVAGVDPTIFVHEGRWWLFCTDARSAWNADLYAWYADDLFAEWRPHAGNPIKHDTGSARPGGTPFTRDGRLYRPAQDCTQRYGGRLVINEILVLDPSRFVERVVAAVEPDPAGPFPDGLHTASGCGNLTIVDGNRVRFEPRAAARSLQAFVQKATSGLLRSAR